MKNKPKIVVDTNVFANGLLYFDDDCEKIMNLFDENKVTFLFSQNTAGEFFYVLEKMARKHVQGVDTRTEFLNHLVYIFYHSRSVNTTFSTVTPIPKCEDPEDDIFLELAVHGKADYLVTDDIKSGMHNVDLEDTVVLTSIEFMKLYNE